MTRAAAVGFGVYGLWFALWAAALFFLIGNGVDYYVLIMLVPIGMVGIMLATLAHDMACDRGWVR